MKLYIKRPGGGRRSYSLVQDGVTIQDARIRAINLDLERGSPRDELEARMKIVMDSYREKYPELQLAHKNLAVVEELHKRKILRKPNLARPEDLKRALLRSMEYLGNLSIKEASEEELLACASRTNSLSARFAVIRGMNEVLKYLGRPLLPNVKPDHIGDISHIRIATFLTKAPQIPTDYATYLGTLLATGCRFAELPLAKFQGNRVIIEAQLGRRGASLGLLRRTKNKRKREAPVLLSLEAFTTAWCGLPPQKQRELCTDHYNRIYSVCRRVLGIRIHDLRHSYAIELGSKGVSLDAIARYIGDTIEVTRDHYRGYAATDEEIELVMKKLRAG